MSFVIGVGSVFGFELEGDGVRGGKNQGGSWSLIKFCKVVVWLLGLVTAQVLGPRSLVRHVLATVGLCM